MSVRHLLLCILLTVPATARVSATSIKDVSLEDLFRGADVVALVVVTGGDSVAFDGAVYRAQVLRGFKGVHDKAVLYFGPYSTYALGREYVVFLRRTGQELESVRVSSSNPWPSDGQAPYLKIMYAGYGVLPVEYTCISPGCEYGVSVPTSQVHVPASCPLVRHECDPGSRYDAWAQKAAFLKLLTSLAHTEEK